MNVNPLPLLTRRLRVAAACLLTTLGIAHGPHAGAAVVLDPTLAGEYAAGTGANATFLRISGDWLGTTVYWNAQLQQFSNTPGPGFALISTHDWVPYPSAVGGIWGLADWAAVQAGSVPVIGSWSGVVPTIDHADAEYQQSGYAATWGAVGDLPPGLFAPAEAQDNWTSYFSGYIRITDPGTYNFGVMYDDGFFLRIWGADGSQPYEISSDFLSPRERLGFADDFLLDTGLYRFELGAYDRLEVGVVNLKWMHDGGDWVTVPTDHLVTEPIQIPTPGTIPLLLAAVGVLAAVQMKRKRA
jgi:hypothetical protein